MINPPVNFVIRQLRFVINKINIYQQKHEHNQSFQEKHIIHEVRRGYLESDKQQDNATGHNDQSGPYYQSIFVDRRQRFNHPKPEKSHKKRVIEKRT